LHGLLESLLAGTQEYFLAECTNAQKLWCRPPPQGSTLWKRLVGLGRTALYYGQMTASCELWKAAGHWKGLLPLYALSGDFNAIRYYIHQVNDASCLREGQAAETALNSKPFATSFTHL